MKNNGIKIVLFTAIIMSISAVIGWVFWQQELQYALPTPLPANFVDVAIGDTIDLEPEIETAENRYALLDFFNFDCPCSRFNMKEFERLAHKYKDQVDFFVVIQSDDPQAVERFQDKYDLDVNIVVDKTGAISDKCGVYTTPQAVILDKHSTLYFKGNYNKARFCTKKETRFVDMALGYLLKDEPLPLFMHYAAGAPYGCSLPSDEVASTPIVLFKNQ